MATNKVKVIFDADGTGFHRTMGGITSALTGMKAKLAGAFGGLSVGLIAKSMIDFGDEIQTMANNLNISTDAAQRFTWAARNANVEVAALSTTMFKLDQAVAKWKGGALGGKEVGFLKQLGLSEKDFDVPKEQLLMKMLESTKGMDAGKVASMMSQGLGLKLPIASKIVGAREDILNKNIPIVPEDQIKKLDALGDAFSNLKTIIIQALIPSFIAATKAIVTWAREALTKRQEVGLFEAAAEKKATELGTGSSGLEFWDRRAAAARELNKNVASTFGKGYSTGNTITSPGRPGSLMYPSETFFGIGGQEKDPEKLKKYQDMVRKYYVSLYGEEAVKAGEAAKLSGSGGTLSRIIGVLANLEKELNAPPKPPGTTPSISQYREPILGKRGKPMDIGELASNNFMKIGGFLGADVQYRMARLQEKANEYLARIATAVEAFNTPATNEGQEYPDGGGA